MKQLKRGQPAELNLFCPTENAFREVQSVQTALALVESGPYIFPIAEDSLAMQIAKRRCNLVFVNEGLPAVSAHFVFPKRWPLTARFDEAIRLNGDFIRRTYRKYFHSGFMTYNRANGTCAEQFLDKMDGHREDDPRIIRFKPLGQSSLGFYLWLFGAL